MADAPAAARTPKQQRTKTIAAPSTLLPAEQPDFQAGGLLDPDGRPTVLTENALTIPVPDANKFPLPGPQQDPKGFPYRSSWSMQDGIWKKLEDRVAWSEVGARNIATYRRPVERLVTSFSPDQDKGLQSTAETQRGMKRDADQSGLPPREGRPPNMSDAAQPSASVYPPAEQPQHAEALPVYSEECDCADQRQDLEFSQCARCSSHSFVTDPRQVTNWFDEVEERQALQQLQDLTYDFQTKHWSSYPRAAVQEATLPARDTMDGIHDNEALVLDVGQAFQQLPEDALQDHRQAWSVATKENDTSDWHWQSLVDDINVAVDTLQESMKALPNSTKKLFIKHNMKDLKPARKVKRTRVRDPRPERHWLRRHGRCNIYLAGWDGSSPELQPLFQHDDFAKIYHSYVTDIANKKFATMDAKVNDDVEAFQKSQQPS